jgi:uncharacterized Zn finger protein (UPF0148 family)
MGLSDKELEQISKALERGGKMLGQHCENCHSPLFKIQDKIVCPVCEYRKAENSAKLPKEGRDLKMGAAVKRAKSTEHYNTVPIDEYVTNVIINIAEHMQVETDLSRVQIQLECIERGLKILRIMRGE